MSQSYCRKQSEGLREDGIRIVVVLLCVLLLHHCYVKLDQMVSIYILRRVASIRHPSFLPALNEYTHSKKCSTKGRTDRHT
jgi:hypothetical protein